MSAEKKWLEKLKLCFTKVPLNVDAIKRFISDASL